MRIIVFEITEADERKAEEITLNGIIDGKLARGDYVDTTPEQFVFATKVVLSEPPT